jgi:molybdopterin-guanine dinucleotide biosynthesis protein A
MKVGIHLISICILCGGKSKRFGGNKIFHKLGDKTILEIVYDKFEDLSDDVFFQVSDNTHNNLKLDKLNAKIYHDLFENKGPLGGIYSALKHAKYDKVLIIAGDLPFIDRRIVHELNRFDSNDLIVPKWNNGHVEPLCALYSKMIMPIIKKKIESEDLKISNLFTLFDTHDGLNIQFLKIDELIELGKVDRDCFKNINTKDDLSVRMKEGVA